MPSRHRPFTRSPSIAAPRQDHRQQEQLGLEAFEDRLRIGAQRLVGDEAELTGCPERWQQSKVPTAP
jgi:hypothetical protein